MIKFVEFKKYSMGIYVLEIEVALIRCYYTKGMYVNR